MKKVYYYKSFDEDVVKSKNQEHGLPKNYKWIHKNIFYNFFSYVIYYIFLVFALIYCKLILKVRFSNKNVLKKEKNFFIYANHTLELGDVFNPILACFPKRAYTICSSANLGVPVIGRIIPMLGGIVIPKDVHSMIKFNSAISYRINKHPIVIYPEAHLWPYYTGIRPFESSSFTYPVQLNIPVYTFTTTYKEKKHKPRITIYIDGPFYPDKELNKIDARKRLRDTVYNTMVDRSKNSTYEFVTYKKRN